MLTPLGHPLHKMADGPERSGDMVSLIIAENKLVRNLNTGLREKQSRDAERISDLEAQIASFEPSVKNYKDAEKIFGLKRELDSLFQANEASNNLLEITKMKLNESKKKNKEQEKELNKLKNELKKYTDKEMAEKKVLQMGLERIKQANKIQENEREGLKEFESWDVDNLGPPVD
jgi:septal ring factor EnvC (AmiA/AmiB activator)